MFTLGIIASSSVDAGPKAVGNGTIGIDPRATYSPGYWGYNDGYNLGTFSLTSGSYADAFGQSPPPAPSTSVPVFTNFQLGTIAGDNTIYFRMIVTGVNNPTTWSSLSVTVGGTTTTFTRASATLVSTSPNTIYAWATNGEPFSTESDGTAFTWSVS
jgi:hypothetical protein